MAKYQSIPIATAKDIARKYGKSQVIIVAWDPVFGKEHVTTYGATVKDCEQAALGGTRIKQALNWPAELLKPSHANACGFAEMRFGGICTLPEGHKHSHECPCGLPFNICAAHAPENVR